MSKIQTRKADTIGSSSFNPEKFLDHWANGDISIPQDSQSVRDAIIAAFGLPSDDSYVYHAIASVTLAQIQQAIDAKDQHGLHAWYPGISGSEEPRKPDASDIDAYTNIFASTNVTSKALVGFVSNAKKDSLRRHIAEYMRSRTQWPSAEIKLSLGKLKRAHNNPYLDYWSWSCRELEWAGPDESTVQIKHSHHLLPLLYHHFGCICPTYDALAVIQQLAAKRNVIDLGSGNGYWTFLLRRMGVRVTAIDNGDSHWRTCWIDDTVTSDGVSYLKQHDGGKDDVLLLVYPQVGANFTANVLKAYKGDTIVIAGTQNGNGFTAFKDVLVTQWMKKDMPNRNCVLQIPLPSFAGKDEALFAFQKK